MKYRLFGEEFVTREQAEEWADDNLLDSFRDYIDELHETITILGMHYSPSKVLEEVDPIAFNCEYSNYVDYICSENIEEVDE